MLIGHFKRRLEGGTLFNRDRGRWPERQRLDRPDRFPSRKDASIATIPTQAKPLSNGEHVEAYKAQPNFAPTAKLRLVTFRRKMPFFRSRAREAAKAKPAKLGLAGL